MRVGGPPAPQLVLAVQDQQIASPGRQQPWFRGARLAGLQHGGCLLCGKVDPEHRLRRLVEYIRRAVGSADERAQIHGGLCAREGEQDLAADGLDLVEAVKTGKHLLTQRREDALAGARRARGPELLVGVGQQPRRGVGVRIDDVYPGPEHAVDVILRGGKRALGSRQRVQAADRRRRCPQRHAQPQGGRQKQEHQQRDGRSPLRLTTGRQRRHPMSRRRPPGQEVLEPADPALERVARLAAGGAGRVARRGNAVGHAVRQRDR